ncbi:hypothetical protein KP509_02G051700 [Ceratopteris richardii]|uniref:Oxysterol-binding protein n=1 Tax=Ceratopteris richardii TaxID=49495 RepID=A0A8T2VCW8_CERRI|nr:hypothetical protein KP509_02G051700 [Ceratopteris richardii]
MDALRKEEQKCETDHQDLVIVPPISLDYKPADEKSLFNRVIDLCKTIRPGADLTRFQIPVQFNLPKSQLQTYGEFLYCCGQDLLGACADGASPLERLLRVVAWHISTTRYVPFSQVPFNPILGETHHVSAGHLNVLLEQVSHHPPVVALYATDDVKKIRTQWSHKAVGRFHGNKVEGTIYGKRTLWLDSHHEVYELTCPKIVFRLFPAPGTEWVGTSTIKCGSSNLEASLTFKGKPLFGLKGTAGHVSGKIYDTSTGATLYEINGAWNKTITAKSTKTEESSLLFDAQAALTNLRSPVLQKKGLDGSESLVVWRPAMSGIVNRDWEAARQAKHEIEERQRHLEKKRKMEGKIWKPRYFVKVDADHHWQWCHFGETVPPAPLVIPSCHVNT